MTRDYMPSESDHFSMPNVKAIVLQPFLLKAQKFLQQRGMLMNMKNVQIEHYFDQMLQDMIVTMEARLASVTHTEVVQHTEDVPADWWQHVRVRWAPTWWLKRYPIETIKVTKREEKKTIKVCPHIEMPANKPQHFQWLENPNEVPEPIAYRFKRFVMFLANPNLSSDPVWTECSPRLQEEAKKLLAP